MIALERVSKVHGKRAEEALRRLDLGEGRAAVERATGARVALHDVSLALEPGELVSVMALAGGGKSSLLRVMNGLVVPDRGRVLVEDEGGHVDLMRASSATVRRVRQTKVSMVFSDTALLPWRTVAENVRFGLELRGGEPDELEHVVNDKLALLGLEAVRDAKASTLGPEEQRKVSIARALVMDTAVVLLDDPFRGLDAKARVRLDEDVLRVHRALGVTLVFATSDMDEALRLGDRVVVLAKGRIAQIGTADELVATPATDTVREIIARPPSLRASPPTSRRSATTRTSGAARKTTSPLIPLD